MLYNVFTSFNVIFVYPGVVAVSRRGLIRLMPERCVQPPKTKLLYGISVNL